jgi:hypothetical protein
VAALPSVVRVPQGLISGGQRRRGGRRQWARVGSVRGVPQPGAGWGGAKVVAGVHAPVPRLLRVTCLGEEPFQVTRGYL